MDAGASSMIWRSNRVPSISTLPGAATLISNPTISFHRSARRPHDLPRLPSFSFRPQTVKSSRFAARSSIPTVPDRCPPQELAILLEVDGVLIDVHHSGNRQAFNVAFQKLGLDCANWTSPIYSDLFRKSAGDEKRMLVLFFNRVGWPTSLPSSEKENFMISVLKEKKNALGALMKSGSIPIRPGVEKFIDDACYERIPVVVLTTSSELGEEIARASIEKLGIDRITKLMIVGNDEVEKSLISQFVLGQASFSGLGEELAGKANKAVASEKQRVAEEVASLLKLRVDINGVSDERMKKIVASLRAGAEYAGVSAQNCVLVAGTHSGVSAADRIGMPCIMLRSSLTSSARFPSVKSVMDGFGDIDLTISKLKRKLLS